jgi:uroporphyrinogen III methyltransferase/synthase
MTPLGMVYLVGAGPGDPELLTLKARRLLGEADTVVYDHLIAPELLEWTRTGCERIFVGKKGGGFCEPQGEIDRLLVRLGRAGRTVVRLKGGDPFIFGRGGEEAVALVEAGVPFEVVPGVTAALAAAAYAGIPLTHRAHSSAVVFLTGHEDPAKAGSSVVWEDYARLGATLCIYMGMKNLPSIVQRLVAGGLDPSTPAALIQSATTGEHRQKLAPLGALAEAAAADGFAAPALVIIGEVAAFSERLDWFESARRAGTLRGEAVTLGAVAAGLHR